jgi:hypothetical protein
MVDCNCDALYGSGDLFEVDSGGVGQVEGSKLRIATEGGNEKPWERRVDG